MQRENAKYFFLQLSDSNLYFNKQVHSTNIKNDFKAILKSNKQQHQLKSTNIVKPFKNEYVFELIHLFYLSSFLLF